MTKINDSLNSGFAIIISKHFPSEQLAKGVQIHLRMMYFRSIKINYLLI